MTSKPKATTSTGNHTCIPEVAVQTPLADFLIEFLLVEFAINGDFAGTVPQLDRASEDGSVQQDILFNSTTGFDVEVGLFGGEVLALKMGSGTRWITPRDADAARLLLPWT